MFIQPFPSGPFSTNAYLIACLSTQKAIIVDPAPESANLLLDCLRKHHFILQSILLTHSHWDHIADINSIKKLYDIPIYVHPLDQLNLEKPGSDGLPCWITIQPVKANIFLNDEDLIPVGQLTFKVIHTPGHSPGSVCFYEISQSKLLSGDTLFKGSIGNISFPTSQPDLMWTSLDKLAQLPPSTSVYPGHGPMTTIGNENWLPRAKQLFQ
ncbi:MBL fold metallo-hydrolase [Candidatus Protochlamydia sp. W-9]|uniref:MBL fold metallo-hydrolase n=1 Tax=Candidatus Protochlamydia sp. W-9 TaxID=1785087 RepID=UPI00096AA41C|nr:MBL fold metallo-hydrolase [Candidatus Protochlamydia sp. W-9]